jgi:hypothetical protein
MFALTEARRSREAKPQDQSTPPSRRETDGPHAPKSPEDYRRLAEAKPIAARTQKK